MIGKHLAEKHEEKIAVPSDEKIKELSDVIGFDRLGNKCVYCDAKCKNSKTTNIDELIPPSEGGRMNKCNMVRCCGNCNSSKGAKELAKWRVAKGRPLQVPLIRERIDIIVKYVDSNKHILTDPYFIPGEAKKLALQLIEFGVRISEIALDEVDAIK
jgi:hypothetical protein